MGISDQRICSIAAAKSAPYSTKNGVAVIKISTFWDVGICYVDYTVESDLGDMLVVCDENQLARQKTLVTLGFSSVRKMRFFHQLH